MHRCPDCGRPVENFFEHVNLDDCQNMTDAEIAAHDPAALQDQIEEIEY